MTVYTGGGIEETLLERERRELDGSVLCRECGQRTIDVVRRVHDRCRTDRPPVADCEFPAREWGGRPPPEPHPEPEVVARPALQGEVVRGASLLMNKVQAPWSVTEVLYFRGTKLTRARPLVEGCVVRLHRDDGLAAAVAVWLDGKFEDAFEIEQGTNRGWVRITATELKKKVGGAPAVYARPSREDQ